MEGDLPGVLGLVLANVLGLVTGAGLQMWTEGRVARRDAQKELRTRRREVYEQVLAYLLSASEITFNPAGFVERQNANWEAWWRLRAALATCGSKQVRDAYNDASDQLLKLATAARESGANKITREMFKERVQPAIDRVRDAIRQDLGVD